MPSRKTVSKKSKQSDKSVGKPPTPAPPKTTSVSKKPRAPRKKAASASARAESQASDGETSPKREEIQTREGGPSVPSAPDAPAVPSPAVAPDAPASVRAPSAASAGETLLERAAIEPREGATSLRIVMIASEATPFSKTGGLADVATALSKALGRMGHHVTLVTPRYRGAGEGEPGGSVRAYIADHWFEGTLLDVPLGPGARALLVDCPPLYNRAGLYTERNIDYPDNPLRFAFLSVAALEWAAEQETPPSVFHIHDWQTGLTPVYARRFVTTKTRVPFVQTLHNLAYQGISDKLWVPRLGLSWDDFTPQGFEFYDRLSFLKAGVTFSDALTTVSPTYAEEIQRPEYGYGLDGVIRARRDVLTGILNGIDTDDWNPATDRYLPAPYHAADLSGKRLAKRALLETFGLPADEEALGRPVIGMVSRLVQQKGLDLIEALARHLPHLDAAFTVVGTGDPRYERLWRELSAAYPNRISAFIGFDEGRAHLVEGGADAFLMPSRFEPCGLNQMYSMRYGTVPIVRAVGGLVDTVKPYNPRNGDATGFLFSDYEPAALLATIEAALETYRERPADWRRLQVTGMRQDFSWERSASEYVTVYKGVMAMRANP